MEDMWSGGMVCYKQFSFVVGPTYSTPPTTQKAAVKTAGQLIPMPNQLAFFPAISLVVAATG